MKLFNLEDMVRGWFVGDFEPTALHADFEVGVRFYKMGDCEPCHYHIQAKELTLILDGKVKMAGMTFNAGEIIIIEEYDNSAFECIEDCTLVIVKTKSVKGDKYPC